MKKRKNLPPKIRQAINYHTNRLARTFRLQSADKDDVRQELTLKALEIMQYYSRDIRAAIETYTKHALSRKAVDIARAIIASPQIISIEAEYENIVVHMNLGFVMDLQTMIKTLSARQRKVFLMLVSGYTQEQIAKRMGITKRGVCFHIQTLRQIFKNLKNVTS